MKPISIYHRTNDHQRRQLEGLPRADLEQMQLTKLNETLADVLPQNSFYQSKFAPSLNAEKKISIDSWEQFRSLPFTTKTDLVGTDSDTAGFASNLTMPLDQYVRFHRTSGTRGQPMVVLDSESDWQWWLEGWQYVLDAAQIDASDRVIMAFSFGPFIGFWSAFDAVTERNAMVVPTGALSSLARLELIQSLSATAVFCTPSYALHLAAVASEHQLDNWNESVKTIVVAGEPGGSIPSVREKIESTWQARLIDHSGASEVGPWGFPDANGSGLYVNEAQFIAEFLPLNETDSSQTSELSELVLTTLGRAGAPVIRYRTGDLVKPTWDNKGAPHFVLLKGGVLGRTDDMMIIRGVNLFPSSVAEILRSFPEVVEYRITATREKNMDQLKIEVEDHLNNPQRIADRLALKLGFRVEVEWVPANSLPRFEAKGKRFVDLRNK